MNTKNKKQQMIPLENVQNVINSFLKLFPNKPFTPHTHLNMKTSNKNAAEYVKQKLPFTGNNTFGNWWHDSYVVYSYGIHYPLYVYKNGLWFENSTKYSTTTSRHKTQLRPTLDTQKKTTQELIDLITK